MNLVTPYEPAFSQRDQSPRDGATTSGHAVRETSWIRLEMAAASARGRRREVNEDWHSGFNGSAPLFVVADGVGGGAMAAQASRELVSRLHAALDGRRIDAPAIRDALLYADREVGRSIASVTGASGAATVALCAATDVLLSRWLIAWVGDCRVYRVRAAPDEPAQALTVDDTYRHLGETPPPGGPRHDPARMVGNGGVPEPDAPRAAADTRGVARRRGRALGGPHRGARGGAMTPEQIDRVFGRGRLKMVTGEHVEVFREAVARGERRRYTKRFLNTREGDFGQWTEREWRILARLIGHGIACVPDVVQFDRGRLGGTQLVQTYDAGVTVDQWATLLPMTRDGRVHRHVFEDCAHWWALAHHCLLALHVIHPLELVHLDIKGDNVCIPYAPASFDPDSSDLKLRPVFAQLALIDFAFALVSRESLTTPLPLGWQKDYDYQSPRLLAALEAGRNGELQLTRELDWRCDMYSLAAMLKRHLPDESLVLQSASAAGWTAERYDAAKAFILRIRDCHDGEFPAQRPHAALIEQSGATLAEPELALSLERGWTLAREASVSAASASPLTPVTRLAPVTVLAPPIHVTRSGRITAVTVVADTEDSQTAAQHAVAGAPRTAQPQRARHTRGPFAAAAVIATWAVAAAVWYLGDRARPIGIEIQSLAEPTRAAANQAADAIRRLVLRDKEAQE